MSGTPTPIVVTGCADCPFENDPPGFEAWCDHDEAPSPVEQRGLLLHPDWCPLRTSPALVVLRPEGLKSPPLDGTE